MNFKPLAWDSEFFARSVAALSVEREDVAASVIDVLDNNVFDVCYIFGAFPLPSALRVELSAHFF